MFKFVLKNTKFKNLINIIDKRLSFLYELSIFIDKLDYISFFYLISFILIGIVLNLITEFNHFYIFITLFTMILLIVIYSQKIFIKYTKELRGSNAYEKNFERPNYYMFKSSKSKVNFLFPVFFVFIFLFGGLFLFETVTLNITLIYVLSYFIVIVFLSMRSYLMSFYLAQYIYNLSKEKETYKDFSLLENNILPFELSWINNISKLFAKFQLAFFLVGLLYIAAFASFCFLPDFGVQINSTIFIILWLVIFIFVVLGFPILAFFMNFHMKKVANKFRNDYIQSLVNKNFRKLEIKEKWLKDLYFMTRNNYIAEISKARISSVFSVIKLSTYGLGIANFFAIIVTLLSFFDISYSSLNAQEHLFLQVLKMI